MSSRINAQTDLPLAAKLWTASYLLMGLRDDESLINNLLTGMTQMEESVTYQHLVKKGESSETRRMVLMAGQEKFGPPSPAIGAAIAAISDTPKLENLVKRVFHVSTWDDLLKPN